MRRNRFSKLLFSSLGAGMLWGSVPQLAHTQGMPVYDNAALIRQVMSHAQRVQQIEHQRQQILYQVQALRKLATPNWREINGYLAQLDRLAAEGNAIGYTLANLDAEFRGTYPGYQVPTNAAGERGNQAARTMATMLASVRAAQAEAVQTGYGNAQLRAMKGQMSGLQGHQEALEMQSTLLAFSAEEMQMLRRSIAQHTSQQAVYNAYQIQQQEQARAFHDETVRRTRTAPRPQYQRFDGKPGRRP